ncbi:hypothetical protein H5410_014360 [Solanum commersonii]|uniref:Uncharacterized protein n=1 Tax=Solanum commersonii TaxID=4109 RepID=A0A9J5ZQT6_SOLCO|nr:hypothetical protein H5410_014360 [Solanum commersonii]
MEWVAYTLKEASKSHGYIVRRWKHIVKNNKWSTRELNGARIQKKGNSLIISDAISTTQNESLAKSCRIPTGGNPRDPTMGRKHLEAQSWNQYLRSGGN